MSWRYLLVFISFYIVFTFFNYYLFQGFDKFSLVFLDVGQGDAILIGEGQGTKILVDGGPGYDIDAKIDKKLPPLSCSLSLVVATHPDYDHINGLNRLLQRCKVRSVMFNDIPCDTETCKEFRTLSSKNKVIPSFKDDEFIFKDLTIKILWPTKEYYNEHLDDKNNLSTVLLVDHGGFEALLTGDVGGLVFDKLDEGVLEDYIQEGLDVFKAPHHGASSGLNRGFLAKWRPKNCIISVGGDNSYGHPHREVLDFYSEIGCKVYRTDLGGDVEFVVK